MMVKMDRIIKEVSSITEWKSYEEFVPWLEKIIATDEFKEFPALKDEYYIEALAYYALENWNQMNLTAKALLLSRHPIFVNKIAIGKTVEEYNKEKLEIHEKMQSLGLPKCELFKQECQRLYNTIPRWQYFSFFPEHETQTALTIDECKRIAQENNMGLICFYLTYELSVDLLPSIVVYNQITKGNKLVDTSLINSSKLILETEPKISDKEYEVIIDKDLCYCCLDYGMVGYYSICKFPIKKDDILNNRCIYCCSNDFLMENIKLKFLNDFNNINLSIGDFRKKEIERVGRIINENWNNDKSIFIKNIQFLKEEDYPLYLYLYWIKNEESIHEKYQAYQYAMQWI